MRKSECFNTKKFFVNFSFCFDILKGIKNELIKSQGFCRVTQMQKKIVDKKTLADIIFNDYEQQSCI